jgi:hypothetical protein
LTNADTFALFALEVGTGKWKSFGFPSDRYKNCDAWRPDIVTAMGRAQQWNRIAANITRSRNPKLYGAWEDLRNKYFGPKFDVTPDLAVTWVTEDQVQRIQKTYAIVQEKLNSSQTIECHLSGGEACSDGFPTAWTDTTLHLCWGWKGLPPGGQAKWILAGLYGLYAGERDWIRRSDLANLARDLTERFFPV